MALVIPPGFGQAVYRFSLVGDPEEMVCTLGVDLVGSDYQAQANGLASQFSGTGAWVPSAILLGYTFIGVRLYVGQDGGPPAVYESNITPAVGTNAGPALPPNCAFLVQKLTGLGGRKNRGRLFLPAGLGVGEDSVPATGVMAEAQRSALNDRAIAAFLAEGSLTKVILHDSTSPGSSTPTPITNLRLQARLATVRRRLRP